MSKRKPKKPYNIDRAMSKMDQVNYAQGVYGDPWPVICPACEGNAYRQLHEDAAMPFEAIVGYECDCPENDWIRGCPMGFQRIICARCDGRGTVVG